MPLFDSFRMAKSKNDVTQDRTSTDLSYIPDNDFFELIWENGQITVQGQSSRTKKTQNSYNLPCYTSLPSHGPRSKDKELGNGNTCSTSGKFVSFDDNPCGLDGFPDPVPSGEMRLDQDDDIVPWFSYPINDFLHELSGVTDNHEPTIPNSFDAKGSCNQVDKEGPTRIVDCDTDLEERYQSKGSGSGLGLSCGPAVCEITTRTKNNSSQQQGLVCPGRSEMDLPCSRSRLLEKDGIGSSNAANQVASKDSMRLQTEHPGPSSSANFQFINFSHFSRPPPISRTYAETGGGAGLGFLNINRASCKEKASSANRSNNAEIDHVELNANPRREESGSQCPNTTKQLTVCSRDVKGKQTEEQHNLKHSEPAIRQNASEKDKKSDQNSDLSTTRRPSDDEKSTEPVVVASSVCSGNGVEGASEDPCSLKRKSRSTEESDAQSEDVEEVSVGVKKGTTARGSGSKRGRAAEVHNLSERRRRDRINEKMRALQELIPNCNKADKASMLDEAIEYLKTLQLQVQMMSMGAGFYMPHMLLPAQMQQMHMARMAQFMPLGYGMGMVDINSGSSTYPMMQVPPMHGPHFPAPSPVMPGPAASVVGLPSQGLHTPMACGPFVPFPCGGSILQPANGVPAPAAAANEGLQQSVQIQNNYQVSDNNGNAILPP